MTSARTWEWRDRAACKGETEAFFSRSYRSLARARALCGECPVREECLDMALADPGLEGLWGGTIEAERRKLRKSRVA
jgi:WhiB family redox-sensing transcriptional regulator